MSMRTNILIILLVLGLAGCSDFLEEKSQSEIRPSTVKDMEKILEGEAYFVAKEGTMFNRLTDIFTDDVRCNMVTDKTAMTRRDIERYRFAWDKTMFDENGGGVDISFWQLPYERIKGCNVVVEYIADMEGDEAKRNHIAGEAYTLRGFYYLMLVNFFGLPYNYGDATKNPGVPLKLTSGITDERLARNSVADCYKQIIEDLSKGAELMAAGKEKKSVKLDRLSHLAGYALLSRAYLYMEDWDNALKYADFVLEEKADLLDLGTTTGGVYYVTTPAEILWNGVEERGNNSTSGSTGTKYGYTVSEELASLYFRDADGFVDRRGNYKEEETWGGTVTPVFLKQGKIRIAGSASEYDYWVAMVAKGSSVEQSRYNGGIRTAEMYLNRAEVYVRRYLASGNSADAELALKDLNTLRRNRFKGGYAEKQLSDYADGQELLDFCLRERRRELCSEGNHRWFDLRRLGMPEIRHVFLDNGNGHETTYTLFQNDPRYALPIPEGVMQKNGNLIQN